VANWLKMPSMHTEMGTEVYIIYIWNINVYIWNKFSIIYGICMNIYGIYGIYGIYYDIFM
jgi:hypothetical protein